jgi:hypothetical protein
LKWGISATMPFRRLAQKGKMDYNEYKKGEQRQLKLNYIKELRDGNFP